MRPPFPRHWRTTQASQATTRTPTSTTASTLLLSAAPTSPCVRSLTARSPPHPGHCRPVMARNGQVPKDPDVWGSRSLSTKAAASAAPAVADGRTRERGCTKRSGCDAESNDDERHEAAPDDGANDAGDQSGGGHAAAALRTGVRLQIALGHDSKHDRDDSEDQPDVTQRNREDARDHRGECLAVVRHRWRVAVPGSRRTVRASTILGWGLIRWGLIRWRLIRWRRIR